MSIYSITVYNIIMCELASKLIRPSYCMQINMSLLSGVPDYFGRNKISSGGDPSHYSSASLY